VVARRVIEGGHQWVRMQTPALITVANSYENLHYKSIQGAKMVQNLKRNPELQAQYIKTVTLDDVNANPLETGLKGSPTIVARTDKVGELGGSCKMYQGESADRMVHDVLQATNVLEFALA
jgi:electron transfer flavoprotein beta subunit